KNNKINGYKSYGISFNGIEYFEIENNILESGTTGSASTAMNLANSSGFVKSADGYGSNIVANNIINAHRGGGVTFSGKYLDFFHNTVRTQGSALYLYYETENTNIENNIFSSLNGYAVEIPNGSVKDSYVMKSNVLYTENNDFVLLRGVSYRDIFEYRNYQKEVVGFDDYFSICAKPFFEEDENGVLAPQSYVISKIGLNTSNRVTADIYGMERAVMQSTPGAVQRYFPQQELPETVIVDPTGQGDFETIQDALNAFASHGLNKNCTIKIEEGEYFESNLSLYTIPIIDYSDIENYNNVRYTLTVTSESGATITNSSADAVSVFNICGADYVKINNISFKNNGETGSALGLIKLLYVCDNIEISDCQFNLISTNTTTRGIFASNNFSRNWTFQRNYFENEGTAIDLAGFSSARLENVIINNNVFDNTQQGISVTQVEGSEISENKSYNSKISISYSGSLDFSRNRVFGSGFSGTYSNAVMVGIYHAIDADILTNIIKITDSNIQSLKALDINYNCKNINVLHNTLSVEQSNSSGKGTALSLQGTTDASLINNILSVEGYGYALLQGGTDVFLEIRNNCYYADGPSFAWVDGEQYYDFYDFSGKTGYTYEMDGSDLIFHSFLAYPFLDEDGYAHSAYLIEKGESLGDIALETIHEVADSDEVKQWNEDLSPRTIGASFSRYSGDNREPVTADFSIGSDYENLHEALTELMKRGVKGNHVQVLIPSGTINSNIHIRAIPGNNHFALVSLIGDEENMPMISYASSSASDNYVLKLSEPNGIRFENLSFNASGSEYSTVVELFGRNNKTRFVNCEFIAPETTSLSDNKVSVKSKHGYNTDLFIHDCEFDGNAYAIQMKHSNYADDNIEISSNNIHNSLYGIQLAHTRSYNINNNTFNNGISSIEVRNNRGTDNSIAKNYIFADYYPVELVNNELGFACSMNNNVIKTSNTNAICVNTNFVRLNFYFNTLIGLANNGTSLFTFGNAEGQKCNNNIFFSDARALCMQTYNPEYVEEMDNNLFFTKNEYLMTWGTNSITTQQELESTGAENCIIADPKIDFLNNGELFSNSPALGAGRKIERLLSLPYNDILERTRDYETPSIGAYEFADAGEPGGATVLASPLAGSNVSVFPNPSNGVFNISCEGQYDLEILNMRGEFIGKQTINNGISEVNIQNQPSGIYFIRLKNEAGLKVLTLIRQ
ncbi:T9SS type A sorting domain-containing protein, partial [Geofilum rubicundum]